ncbi:hypothetical protein KKH23_07180 [Patescibacteria group bacterium]|nr:hypothetical protein [Patescibacteria group bacterium]
MEKNVVYLHLLLVGGFSQVVLWIRRFIVEEELGEDTENSRMSSKGTEKDEYKQSKRGYRAKSLINMPSLFSDNRKSRCKPFGDVWLCEISSKEALYSISCARDCVWGFTEIQKI